MRQWEIIGLETVESLQHIFSGLQFSRFLWRTLNKITIPVSRSWSSLDIYEWKIPFWWHFVTCISPTISVATSVFGRELWLLPNENLWRTGCVAVIAPHKKTQSKVLTENNSLLTVVRRTGSFADLWKTRSHLPGWYNFSTWPVLLHFFLE